MFFPDSYFFTLPERDLRDEDIQSQDPNRLLVQEARSGQVISKTRRDSLFTIKLIKIY